MNIGKEEVYPDVEAVLRTVEVGGLTKPELLKKLADHSVELNEYGKKLLLDDKFTVSETPYSLKTVQVSVNGLGFPDGATTAQLFRKAGEAGLVLGPAELGPYLRLQILDQPEGDSGGGPKRHQAPAGSITVATELLSDQPDFPKGFYLRRIQGVLWLRGYVADDLHVWSPDDHFVFVKKEE